MKRKILVVDDHGELRDALKKFLTAKGYDVATAVDGDDGRLLAAETGFDLALLDGEMPGLGGHDLCRLLKNGEKTAGLPVIIMSGNLVEEEDVVAGFEGGADDYVLKPFAMRVLHARIEAVLRRYAGGGRKDAPLKSENLELDPASREAKVDGKRVPLTRKEFDLLTLLMEKSGRVLKASFLLEAVWGYDLADYNDTHTVETHISRLRKKIGAGRIENVTGHGYKFTG